jgi:SAM-dependent methyltransferase
MTAPTNFDHLARPYRWLEYLTFGPMLERCRFCRIPELHGARHALVLGDGDGRFLARLLAANPMLQADVVDQSPAMLRLLQARAAAAGGSDRIRIHQADVLTFQPPEPAYDLVVTHFFLDCFTTEQVRGLVGNLRPHLAPGALWINSEFAIPRGIAALPSRVIVSSLYLAFRILTGLRTRALPDHATVFGQNGLKLRSRHTFLAELLASEQWMNGKPNLDEIPPPGETKFAFPHLKG